MLCKNHYVPLSFTIMNIANLILCLAFPFFSWYLVVWTHRLVLCSCCCYSCTHTTILCITLCAWQPSELSLFIVWKCVDVIFKNLIHIRYNLIFIFVVIVALQLIKKNLSHKLFKIFVVAGFWALIGQIVVPAKWRSQS